MNFAKFLKTPFFTKHLWWLLLIVIKDIDVKHNQKASRRTKQTAGPAKFDGDDWPIIIGLKLFEAHSLELRNSQNNKKSVLNNFKAVKICNNPSIASMKSPF